MKKRPHLKQNKKSTSETSIQKITIDTSTKKVTLPDGTTMEVKDKLTLEMLKYRLDFEMGNSFAGLEAFVKAFLERAYPPLWTIDWIAHAFINYRNDRYRRICQPNGNSRKKSLDDFLGLSSKKRLTDGEKDLIDDKNTKLFMAVSSLICLGINPKRAFLEVSKDAKSKGFSHTESSIRKNYFYYRRIYTKYAEICKRECLTWSKADKKEFLSHYNLSN
jgi:hypothetical protein